MKSKEYELHDYMEMFIPELLLMFLFILLFTVIGGFVGAKFAIDYEIFGANFFESGFTLGLLAGIGALALLFISAYFGIRYKIQRKIWKKIQDRHY